MLRSDAGAFPRAAWTGSVYAKAIRDQRRPLRWWLLGVIAVPTMYLAVWPSIQQNAADFDQIMRRMPEFFRSMVGNDFTSPAGYLRAELFAFMGPILLVVFAIGTGARATAADERTGVLDLLLSAPVSRRRVQAHKAAAMATVSATLVATIVLTTILLGPVFGLHISVANLLAMALHLLLFALAFGMIALAVGAATGRRGVAIGVAGGLAVLSFVLYTVAPSIGVLEPLRPLSLYYFYFHHNPLKAGVHWLDVGVLVAVAAVALMVAIRTFERRDLAA